MEIIMIQIKKLLIILLVLFCCCSKSSSDTKIYRTAILNLRVYANPEEIYFGQEIGEIPFMARVEIVDNNEIKRNDNDDDNLIKIKYKDTIGYVYSTYLSERSNIPFVDKVKYDYSLNEFAYNRKEVIDFVKEDMIEYGRYEEPLSKRYYIDDPQVYTFYGKDCDGEDAKYIMVIMISKLHKDFNYHTAFIVDNKNEYRRETSGINNFTEKDGIENVKDYIEVLKSGGEFCNL